MRFDNTEVFGFENAILGARLPMCTSLQEAKEKSDSFMCDDNATVKDCEKCRFLTDKCELGTFDNMYIIGEKDIDLLKRLIKADDKDGASGQPNSKFLRQIHVQVCITAPAYFMAELDTYKIGTTRNSSSFMHKGTSKPFEIEDFEVDEEIKKILSLNQDRKTYDDIQYPYETDEFKIYTTDNGRQYEVYRNGKIISCEFEYKDNYGSGRIRHFERIEKKPTMVKGGYFQINLGGRNCEKWLLHRLVATVWLENPNNFETVDHINGDKSNCSVENLEWVSREENVIREHRNGLSKRDIHSDYLHWKKSSKIDPCTRLEIRKLYYENKISQKELSHKYNLSQSQISVIIRDVENSSSNKELFENAWYWERMLETLNELRDKYLETKDIVYFRLLRQLLPMGYNYVSMFDCNYATLRNICSWRSNHKLNEWSGKDKQGVQNFMDWVSTLPYAKELLLNE